MSAPATDMDEPDPRAVAAERMTFFADAVIAIAITLLALELPFPESTEVKTNGELWHLLGEGRHEYIAFLISFYVIGRHWVGHHRMFRYVTRLGNGMTVLTLVWLLMIVITPFATKVLSSGDNAFQLRFGIYAGIQALAGLLFIAMIRLVQAQGNFRPDMPEGRFTDAYVGAGGAAAGFLISIPISFLTQQAYDLWVIVPVLAGLLRAWTVRAKNQKSTADSRTP